MQLFKWLPKISIVGVVQCIMDCFTSLGLCLKLVYMHTQRVRLTFIGPNSCIDVQMMHSSRRCCRMSQRSTQHIAHWTRLMSSYTSHALAHLHWLNVADEGKYTTLAIRWQ